MRKMKFNLAALAVLAFTAVSYAGTPTFKELLTKEVHKTFEVDSDALLGVQNKYGDIRIETWDQDKIEVDVIIKVKANNRSKAQDFIDAVEIEFTNDRSKVGMKTMYPDQDNNSSWFSWWSDKSNIQYETHYKIRAPRGISTQLIDKYGSIYQEDIEGSTEVVNKYGDIMLERVGGELTLDLGYGKAQVASAGLTNILIKYSSLSLSEGGDTFVDSKYSELRFGDVKKVELRSKYDDFTIRSCMDVEFSGKYGDINIGSSQEILANARNTDFEIDLLEGGGEFDTKYGAVRIAKLISLRSLDILSKYTDYSVGVSDDFQLDFYGEYADPKIKKPYEEYMYVKDGKVVEMKAYRGSKSAEGKIKCSMKYGSFRIK